MPFYSEELIDQVRDSNDIVDVISQYVHLTKKGSSHFGLCPFHNEKTGSFSVSGPKQMFYCFGCGEGGNVISFIMKYENMTFPEAMEYLANRANIELPKSQMTEEQRQQSDKRSRLLEMSKDAAGFYYKVLRANPQGVGMKYFLERQLTPETMKNFGLGCSDKRSDSLYTFLKSKGYSDALIKESGLCTIDERNGIHDRFWNRVIFPILDANGKVIAFGGRITGQGEPKYLNSPENLIFDKSRNLYGLYLAKKTKRNEMILCEGYMDVIALHQAGFDNAVASLGTALTSGHASLLKRYKKDVYLSYDSDGAGQKAALRAIPILKDAGITCKVINMQPYKDPDEFIKNLGPEEYEKRIAAAENSFLYRVRKEAEHYDLSDPEGKSKYYETVATWLASEFSVELERENYLVATAELLKIGPDSLRDRVRQLALSGVAVKREDDEPKPFRKNEKPDDSVRKSERLLLTWISERPKIYTAIKAYISPDDFHEGVYRDVAGFVFTQYETDGKITPAKIVSMFTEDEEQKLVAQIFNTTVGEIVTASDMSKALRETLIKIKENSLNILTEKCSTDPNAFSQMIEAKKKLDGLRRVNFDV